MHYFNERMFHLVSGTARAAHNCPESFWQEQSKHSSVIVFSSFQAIERNLHVCSREPPIEACT